MLQQQLLLRCTASRRRCGLLTKGARTRAC
jgi:hypothetical protein